MLKLTTSGKVLDIKRVSFNITLRSPVANDNGSSYVYSITIPYTDNNAAIFGFPRRLQRKNKQKAVKAGKIWWNNRAIVSGTWHVKTTSDKTISIEMLIDASDFANTIENKSLPDLFDIPITVQDIVAHLESQVKKTWPEVNHNFPVIFNPKFYGDPKETDTDKNPNPQFEGFINNYKTSFIDNGSLNRNTISPQLYLAYILTHIFNQAGYILKSSALTNTMLKASMIYNNVALDKLLATTFEGKYLGNTTANEYVVIWYQNLNDPGNLYNVATGEYTAKIAGDYQINIDITYTRNENYDFVVNVEFNGEIIETKMVIRKVGNNELDSMKLYVNQIVTVTDAGNTFVVKAWFTDNEIKYPVTLGSSTINIVNTTQAVANILKGDFNYKDMVPNIPVKDFMKAIYHGFGLLPFFNEKNKTVTLLTWKELLTNSKFSKLLVNGMHKNTMKITANDYHGINVKFNFTGTDDFSNNGKELNNVETIMSWLDYTSVTIGDIYYIESLNAYYKREYNKDTRQYEINPIADKHPDTIEDDGKKPITLNLAPLRMRCPQNINYAYRNLPSISAQGTSKAYNMQNDFPLRIMFWIGLTDPYEYNSPHIYPFATTTKYDTKGNIVLPINWKTDEILAYYYPEWLQWIKTREKVKFTQKLTAADMAVMDFTKPFLLQYAKIIIEEAYIKLQNRQLGPYKITGWTI